MKITIWKYTGHLIPVQYTDDSKAIQFVKTKGNPHNTEIGMITVKLDYPLWDNQIILEQDKFWPDTSIFDTLKDKWLIDKHTTNAKSWFNTYKVVTLTEKWMKLFQ